jgi:hypothetical protein
MRRSVLAILGALTGAPTMAIAAPPEITATTDEPPAEAGPEAPSAVTRAPSSQTSRLRIAALSVRAPAALEATLLDALRLRLPDVELHRHGDAPPPSRDPHGAPITYAFVGVGAPHDDTVTMIVITSEGAAWSREVVIDEDPATSLARELTVLLASIEAGELAPERTEVEIPPSEQDAAEPGAPPQRAEWSSGEARGNERSASDETEVVPPTISASNGARADRPAPRLRVGASLAPSIAVALPPATYADAFAGAGAALAIEVRVRRRFAVALDLRTLADPRAPLTLLRTRIALGLGASFARGALHLDVLGLASVEPYGVRGGGERLDLTTAGGGGAGPATPLLGGLARLDLAAAVFDERRATVLIGPRLELGASVAPTGRIPALADPRGPAFRPGGLEVALGVVVRVLVGVPAAPSRPAAPASRGREAR